MDDPKLKKLIDKAKATEADGRIWLERHWNWIAVFLALGVGFIAGRLA